MDGLLQDVRYGLRVLWKSRIYTFVAVLTLLLGIGANTAIFSVVYGVLLRPLPYQNAGRILVAGLSVPDYRDLKESNSSFDEMAIWATNQYSMTIGGDSEMTPGAVVSPSFFSML